ncbi:MAG: hypothetical protein N2645_21115 [Clostridia bacterium]|nr:hypothetical protein [Clostridia bacterium]
MINNLELNLVKLAIEKNNDIDLLKSTGNRKCFEYFSESEFLDAKNILVIGAANINNIVRIIETVSKDAKVLILENDETIHSNLLKTLNELKEETGCGNWELFRCYWDNLKLKQDLLEQYLSENSVVKIKDYNSLLKYVEWQCEDKPLVPEGWADLVYIGTMNRFSKELSEKILSQVFDLSQRYGKVLVDIILSDERVTKYVQSSYEGIDYCNIPKEEEIVDILARHSFHGIRYAWRAELPIKVVDSVELRPFLITAYKGKQGICIEKGHAVFYRGPWKEVIDDDGHKLVRGQRMAVCEKTFKVLTGVPYENEVVGISPYFMISDEEASLFDCSIRPVRDPKITKGLKSVKSAISDEEIAVSSKCC